jgi:hypothetical protein
MLRVLVRWTQSTRRHRVGRAHARFVMANSRGRRTSSKQGESAIEWIGPDERGVVLEVLAVVQSDDVLLVIHVMPRALREGK